MTVQPTQSAPADAEDTQSGPSSHTRGLAEFTPGQVIAGKYQLKQRVGAGRFGQVFQAFRVDLPDHLLAIKLLTRATNSRELISRELSALAAVAHPNIVQLSDHGVESDFAWYTMPWYESINLQQQLNRPESVRLSIEEAHRLFVPVAEALVVLHAEGFRHQDIKPENILLAQFTGARERHPIIIDLGLAATHEQQLLGGTPEFMPPEQARRMLGEAAEVGERADVYSLAATVLFSLAEPAVRQELFRKADEDAETTDILNQVIEQAWRRVDPNSGLFAGLPYVARSPIAEAALRWLAPRPESRPSAKEFARELDVLLTRQRFNQRLRRGAFILTGLLALALPILFVADALLNDITTLRERAERLMGVRAKLEATTGLLNEENAQLASQNQQLNRHSTRTQQELREAQARVETQRQKLEDQASRLKNARAMMAEQAADLARKEREKLQLSERGIRLESELKQASQQYEDLAREQRALTEKNVQLETELREAKAETASIRARVDSLGQELRQLAAVKRQLENAANAKAAASAGAPQPAPAPDASQVGAPDPGNEPPSR